MKMKLIKKKEVIDMKLMIASDIHGSAFYCEKMIEAYKREGADRLLLLGDILYHGPRNDLPEGYAPKEVIAMLNPLKSELLCVRGNCDSCRLLLRESVRGEWTGRYNDICNAWTHLSSASSSTIEGWRYSFEWSYAYSCL